MKEAPQYRVQLQALVAAYVTSDSCCLPLNDPLVTRNIGVFLSLALLTFWFGDQLSSVVAHEAWPEFKRIFDALDVDLLETSVPGDGITRTEFLQLLQTVAPASTCAEQLRASLGDSLGFGDMPQRDQLERYHCILSLRLARDKSPGVQIQTEFSSRFGDTLDQSDMELLLDMVQRKAAYVSTSQLRGVADNIERLFHDDAHLRLQGEQPRRANRARQ